MSTSTHPQQHAGLATSVLWHLSLMARRSGGRSPIRLTLQKQMQGTALRGTLGHRPAGSPCQESAADVSFVGSGEYYARTLSLISPRSGGRSPISSRRLDGDSLIPSQLALDEGSPRQGHLGLLHHGSGSHLAEPLHRCRWWTEATHRILPHKPEGVRRACSGFSPLSRGGPTKHDVGA